MRWLILVFAGILTTIHSLAQTSIIESLSKPVKRDFTYYQSPVKNQVNRGTCTAFAIAAAMEIFPGVPSDLSEQHLYAEVKSKGLTAYDTVYGGEYLKSYLEVLDHTGIMHEEHMIYEPNNDIWNKSEEIMLQFRKEIGNASIYDLLMGFIHFHQYLLGEDSYSYYEGYEAKDVDHIKSQFNLFTKAATITYTIYAPEWDANNGNPNDPISPNEWIRVFYNNQWMTLGNAKLLDDNIIDKMLANEVVFDVIDTTSKNYGGHAVTIVGYNQNGFIIKNSWGTDWGDNGYATVSYDYHNLLANELLILRKVDVKRPLSEDLNIDPDIRLKSLPTKFLGKKALQLSIFFNNKGNVPDFERLSFEVMGNNYFSSIPIYKAEASTGSSQRAHGYSIYMMQGDNYYTEEKTYKIIMKYRLKGFPIDYTRVFENVSWSNNEYKPIKQ